MALLWYVSRRTGGGLSHWRVLLKPDDAIFRGLMWGGAVVGRLARLWSGRVPASVPECRRCPVVHYVLLLDSCFHGFPVGVRTILPSLFACLVLCC